MSKARSPREVCSTTIGINGLICSLLASGGPQPLSGRALLFWRPDGLTRGVPLRAFRGDLGRDRDHLGRDAVERLPHPDALADAVGAAAGEERIDVLVLLARVAELGAELVVGDLEPELVCDRLEHELARDRLRRLEIHAPEQVLARGPGEPEVAVDVDAARGEGADEGVQQVARPGLDHE